jgi:hypothetical protein
MKAKTLIAYVVTAGALPLASSWATQPSGPQGTALYGSPAIVMTSEQSGLDSAAALSSDEPMIAAAQASASAYSSGHSADTNPPVPAQ